jgi:hypothetical protein
MHPDDIMVIWGITPPRTALLRRILYWHPKKQIVRNFRKWSAHTREEWAQEANLSVRQYRKALPILVAEGFVESQRAWIFGRQMVLLRLSDVGEKLLSQTTKGGLHLLKRGPTLAQKGGVGGPTSYSKISISEESTGSKKQSEVAHLGDASLTLDIVLDAHHAIGDSHNMKKSTGKAEELLKEITKWNEDTRGRAEDVASASQLEHLWRTNVESYVKPFTIEERGQFRYLFKHCPAGKAGWVVYGVLKNWPAFAATVQVNSGLPIVPGAPKIGFLVKHLNTAIDMLQTPAPKKALRPAKAVHLSSHAAPAQQPADVKATKEEIMAMLAEDAKGE